MIFLVSDAMAQSTGGAGGSPGWVQFLPMVLLFVVFYFLLIRPQQKRTKQHRQMVTELSKGDEVVTNGGLLGKITDVSDNFIGLQIASGVEIKVQRNMIQSMMPKGTIKGSSD
jgi:preprotein translocase subunit YajC